MLMVGVRSQALLRPIRSCYKSLYGLPWPKPSDSFGQQGKEPTWYLGAQLNPLGVRHLNVAKGSASHKLRDWQTSENVSSGLAHDMGTRFIWAGGFPADFPRYLHPLLTSSAPKMEPMAFWWLEPPELSPWGPQEWWNIQEGLRLRWISRSWVVNTCFVVGVAGRAGWLSYCLTGHRVRYGTQRGI